MNNVEKTAARLAPSGLDALLLNTCADIRYCFGVSVGEGDALALITERGAWLLTDRRYAEDLASVPPETHVLSVGLGEGYLRRLNNICLAQGIERLGFSERMPLDEYRACEEILHLRMIPADGLLRGLRAVKTEEEIRRLAAAQALTDHVFRKVTERIAPGVTEKQLAAWLAAGLLTEGADALAFPPMAQSGPNGSFPHKAPTDRRLQKGDLLTLDLGCVLDGFCSDFARTIALGEPAAEKRAACDAVLEAQRAGIGACRPGQRVAEADLTARRTLEALAMPGGYDHAFGHGLGLDLDEEPLSEPYTEGVFQPGMVMCAEPGVYFPKDFGVRSEDAFVIRETGAEFLSGIQRELIQL